MDKRKFYIMLVAIVLSLIIAAAAYIYGFRSPGDDTFIYMRYVGNAIAGHGFVFNIGEQSFGVTSPLWTFVMTPIAALFGNSLMTWELASAACFGLRALITFALSAELSKQNMWLPILLTLVASFEPYTFRWSASGMENSFYMLGLAALAWLYFTQTIPTTARSIAFGAVLGATPFIRPELSIVGGILALFLLLRSRDDMRLVHAFVAAVISFVVIAAAVYTCFGGIIPATAQAKALLIPAGPRSLFDSGVQYGLFMLMIGGGATLPPLIAIRATDVKSLAWKVAILAAVAIFIFYLGWVNMLLTSRYGTQLGGVATFGAAVLIAWKSSIGQKISKWVLLCCATQLVVCAATLTFIYPTVQVDWIPAIKDFADYTRTQTAADARIALLEIGIYSYYADRYIVDTVGLTDPATVEWAKKNGSPRADQLHLDRYLIARQATHFLDTGCKGRLRTGAELNYELVKDGMIPRYIENGQLKSDEWRLYKLVRRGGPPGPPAGMQ